MNQWWISLQVLAPAFWLGMVVAISFLEAPIKFRAPGVTIPIGLGIGRLVFRALNIAEVAVLVVLWVATIAAEATPTAAVRNLLAALTIVLAIQVAGIRPPLSRRSNRILAGEELPRSRAHHLYVAFEVVKVIVLVWLAAATVAVHI
ncbi:hypothetical protein [Rhodococcus spongiicola]|uniref:DUF4149 domain-containing protein n=1 Tax=Rhodococcus spongiicola TaxID=2487352 RepID=A0A3S3E477_9NOCA|nr:hypothetical protein [Rhodococcus spongiicola]RVW04952.1 hypothetical protein EF834_04850 [Rhodococcus spongiicola]